MDPEPATKQTKRLKPITGGTYCVFTCGSTGLSTSNWPGSCGPLWFMCPSASSWGDQQIKEPAAEQTEHARSVTSGIYTLCVYLYMDISIYIFHKQAFIPISQRGEQDVSTGVACVCVSAVVSLCVGLCYHPCVYVYMYCTYACLLGIRAQPHYWLDLGHGAMASLPLPGFQI